MNQATQTMRTNVLPPCTHISLEQLQKNFYDLLQVHIQTCQDAQIDREECLALIKINQDIKKKLIQVRLERNQQKEAFRKCKRECKEKQVTLDLQREEKIELMVICRILEKKMETFFKETIVKTPHVEVFV